MANNPLLIIDEYLGSNDARFRGNAVMAIGALASMEHESTQSPLPGDCARRLASTSIEDPDAQVREDALKEILKLPAKPQSVAVSELVSQLSGNHPARAYEALGRLKSEGIEVEMPGLSGFESLKHAIEVGRMKKPPILTALRLWRGPVLASLAVLTAWVLFLLFAYSRGATDDVGQVVSHSVGGFLLVLMVSTIACMLVGRLLLPAHTYPRRRAGMAREALICLWAFPFIFLAPALYFAKIDYGAPESTRSSEVIIVFGLGPSVAVCMLRVFSMLLTGVGVRMRPRVGTLALICLSIVYTMSQCASLGYFFVSSSSGSDLNATALCLSVLAVLLSFTILFTAVDGQPPSHVRTGLRKKTLLIAFSTCVAGMALADRYTPLPSYWFDHFPFYYPDSFSSITDPKALTGVWTGAYGGIKDARIMFTPDSDGPDFSITGHFRERPITIRGLLRKSGSGSLILSEREVTGLAWPSGTREGRLNQYKDKISGLDNNFTWEFTKAH